MRRIRQVAPVLLALFFLMLALEAIRHELREYSLTYVLRSLAAIPKPRQLSAIALTFLGYCVMTGYDFLAFGLL